MTATVTNNLFWVLYWNKRLTELENDPHHNPFQYVGILKHLNSIRHGWSISFQVRWNARFYT